MFVMSVVEYSCIRDLLQSRAHSGENELEENSNWKETYLENLLLVLGCHVPARAKRRQRMMFASSFLQRVTNAVGER